MDSHNFLSGMSGLIITSAILIAVPGPSVMFFIGQVVAAGRWHAARSVLGNALGMSLIAIILSLGIGELITRSDYTLLVIRLIGALILIMIGLQYLRMRDPPNKAEGTDQAANPRSLVSGIIVGLTNPKALIMFGVVVPSFLAGGARSPASVLLLYSSIPILLGIMIDLVWVMTAHTLSRNVIMKRMNMRAINRIGGGLIIVMAIILVWESLTPLFS
ncbi:LysE family translocator [Modicisalibacter radicis]|uniref:LysE family translocator n=1 Tax=Halomonas sp. EAR18 TaxID=2518972 RepID=UPI00109C9F50|nr:LysE family translocator [Halomonas sp. EAR18]